jgi:type III secretory pathway component EscU
MTDTDSGINEDFFVRGEELVSRDLDVMTTTGNDRGLNLTGVEVLGFLALKVLVPVACAFVKDLLYNEYKNLKTRKAANEAKRHLLESVGPYDLKVDRSTLVRELQKSLCDEGVPASVAKEAVESALRYVQEALTSNDARQTESPA